MVYYADRATVTRIHSGKSNYVVIESVHIESLGFFKVEKLHDLLKKHPEIKVFVKIPPFPEVIPIQNYRGKKYLRSRPDQFTSDNIIKLSK